MISAASPGRRPPAAISAASCSRISSRRSSSRGSIASSASAARFARQRSTAAADGRPRVLVAAERVEQVPLPVLVQQPLLVVLAVDLDQRARSPGASRPAVTVSSSSRAVRPPRRR